MICRGFIYDRVDCRLKPKVRKSRRPPLGQGPIGGLRHEDNVPAVYDGLAARIRALRSKDQGRQTVGGVNRGNGAQRNDLGERNPEPPTGGEA
jgi:hypothetical protein